MNPAIHLLVLTVFIDLIGFGIIIPLLPLYAETFRADEKTIGLLMATFSFWQFLFAPILGRWSDRIGRRPVLLLSMAGTILGYIPMALADQFPQPVALLGGIPLGLLLLFLSRTIDGISGGNIAAAQAYIADITTPEDRIRGMGMIGAAFGLGFIFGPVLGSVLVRYGFHWPAVVAAILATINWVWAYKKLPESWTPGASPTARAYSLAAIGHALRRPVIGKLVILLFVATFAFAAWETTFTLFIKDRLGASTEEAARQAGPYFAYVGFIAVLIQGGLIRRLRGRNLEPRLVLGGTLAFTLGLLGLAVTANSLVVLVALALMALGSGFVNPSLTSLVSQHAGPEEMGQMLGASQGMSALARIIGPYAAGLLYGGVFGLDRSPGLPYLVAAVIMAAAFMMAFTLPRIRERLEEPASPSVG